MVWKMTADSVFLNLKNVLKKINCLPEWIFFGRLVENFVIMILRHMTTQNYWKRWIWINITMWNCLHWSLSENIRNWCSNMTFEMNMNFTICWKKLQTKSMLQNCNLDECHISALENLTKSLWLRRICGNLLRFQRKPLQMPSLKIMDFDQKVWLDFLAVLTCTKKMACT